MRTTNLEDGCKALCGLTRDMVVALVDDHTGVRVSAAVRNECIAIDVTVPRNEMGKVIGKQGRTARALRTILYAAALAAQTRCELNLNEASTTETEATQ